MAGKGFNIRDAQHKVTRALPNGAANVTSTSIDLGNSPNGDYVAESELLISAPILTTAELPDAATMTYDVVMSVNSDLSAPTILAPGVLKQTGAAGAGA